MTSLSSWDVLDIFSVTQVAALAVGDDPAAPDAVNGIQRSYPLLLRMEQDYKSAMGWLLNECLGFLIPGEKRQPPTLEELRNSDPKALVSTEIELEVRLWGKTGRSPGASENYLLNERFAFQEQKFSRWEVARWIKASGIKSLYRFDSDVSQGPVSLSTGRWPWGQHHTELLGHLEAAAKRFWVNHDPTDNTTAPTNQKVSEWLQSERKLSRMMADAIASILRADGLPSGPRK